MSGQQNSANAKQQQVEKRVGRALITYFKPVKVAQPHFPGRKIPQAIEQKPSFKLLQFKKSSKIESNSQSKTEEKFLEENFEPQLLAVPDKNAPWIEVVVHLLKACKRASKVITKKVAVNSYRQLSQKMGNKNVRTSGSILDTTSSAELMKEEPSAEEKPKKKANSS